MAGVRNLCASECLRQVRDKVCDRGDSDNLKHKKVISKIELFYEKK